jgi:DNA-binding winged helix-turn-helix (wHTH) protein
MTLFRFGDFEADEGAFELRRAGTPVRVQRLVLETLFLLLRSRDRVVTKSELSHGAWKGLKVSDAALSRAVMLARRAVDDRSGSIITTVHGKGFRFVADVSEVTESPALVRGGEQPVLEIHQEDRDATPSTRLLGRAKELAFLRRAFEQTRTGRGRLVVVSGDAGIGKTALVERFAHELEGRSAFVAWGRCWRRSEAPRLWPWLEIVRSCAGEVQAEDALSDRGRRLLRELDISSEREESQGPSELLVFDAVARFLSDLARARALVIMIEDLNYADQASVALLEFLRQRIRTTSLLVVATRRVDAQDREGPLDEAGLHVEWLELSGLCSDGVRLMAEALGQALDSSRSNAVQKVTGGNPLAVRELVRSPELEALETLE